MVDHSGKLAVEEQVSRGAAEEKSRDHVVLASSSSSSSSSSSDSESEKKPASVSPALAKVRRLFGREKSVRDVLGGGKPADLFLWRNKKVSGGTLGGLTATWVFFELLEYHLLTLICYGLTLSLSALFIWSNVSTIINKAPPKIPEIRFPDYLFVEFASSLRFEANRVLGFFRDVASGRNPRKFLVVVFALWALSVVGSWCDFLTLFYVISVLLHVLPVVYEKYEDQIESFAEKACLHAKKQYECLDLKVLSKMKAANFLKHKKL